MRTAAAVPYRIGAGGSFHGGELVTNDLGSSHLLIPGLKASFLIAIAENDEQRNPESIKVLKESFEKAELPTEIKVYLAKHDQCPPNTRNQHPELADPAEVLRFLQLLSQPCIQPNLEFFVTSQPCGNRRGVSEGSEISTGDEVAMNPATV